MGHRPNVKFKTIKLLEGNIGEHLGDHKFVVDFSGRTPKTQFKGKKVGFHFTQIHKF